MGHSTVMLSTFVYGLPTSLPPEGQHIVAHREPFFGLWWRPHAAMPGYDVLALTR